MNAFTRSIVQVFRGSAKAFQTFPAAIACAFGFAVVTLIRIQLDWPQQEPYNFLFNSLHWAFAMGAVFSLTVITAAQSRINQKKTFLAANLLGVMAAAVTFLALYQFGGTTPEGSHYAVVTVLAAARVSMAMLVSFLVFTVLAGYPKEQSDFSRSLFMTQKAFFIAIIYGAVIMGGASGVAGAVQALLYHGMSSKVYMVIGTLTGFLVFTIFVGYFPDFRKGEVDEHREVAQKQPRFIEILFGSIMIPIILALTAVLLLWAGKTTMSGIGASSFVQLSGIASAYTIGGIWLHMMVTNYESALAKFYRRVYPIAALVILAFEAWAVVIQLGKSGLKTIEYSFILIWIVALAAAVLLMIRKARSHAVIAVLTCVLAVFSVLPVVGYQELPVTAQVNRLEKILVSQGILQDNQLTPSSVQPERAVRESITDAVDYLASASEAKLPSWFDRRLAQSDVFKDKLGFDKTWPEPEDMPGKDNYIATSLMLPAEPVDISGYRWAINMQMESVKQMGNVNGKEYITIDGDKGTYRIYWTYPANNNIPSLKIMEDDRVILEQELNGYLDQIAAKFPPGKAETYQAALDDMCLKLETPEISVLLVFSNIDISLDPREDRINYWLNLDELYLKEK
ncbi:MAG: DUF4153 domain-containing protein [Dehalobacter sp. 4CP]|uniref:DUF4153 domain-containing protein n=1 Tax=Dehalobacter sp. CP TaxID=2594474 RepID=UPI0013C5AD0D|nr:DUF4153 domain-containing protein [Dehalobacter sp. 4CP]